MIPAFQACIIDTTITIIHQPAGYWQGDLSQANEGNPIGNAMMTNHVSGLFVISGIWLIIIGLAGYYFPKRLSRVFLLFTVIAHSWGASTWVSSRYGFWWVMILILANTITYLWAAEQDRELAR
ncbi:MAG TPA: hypothetical protein DCE41_29465 [Cytophagales bacterium]|nr:hypothetical protein [Cytophagales bacterium]